MISFETTYLCSHSTFTFFQKKDLGKRKRTVLLLFLTVEYFHSSQHQGHSFSSFTLFPLYLEYTGQLQQETGHEIVQIPEKKKKEYIFNFCLTNFQFTKILAGPAK